MYREQKCLWSMYNRSGSNQRYEKKTPSLWLFNVSSILFAEIEKLWICSPTFNTYNNFWQFLFLIIAENTI